MSVGRKVHMSLSVRGALRWPKSRLRGLFLDAATGRRMSAEESREELMNHLAQGHEVLPMALNCHGFDFKRGCPGHTDEEQKETAS